MNKLPILILDKDLLFPGCYKTLPLEKKHARILDEVITKSVKSFSNQLLVVPIAPLSLLKRKTKSQDKGKKQNLNEYGVLAEIRSIEEPVEEQNSKQVQINLYGLERVKINSFDEKTLIGEFEQVVITDKDVPQDVFNFSRKFFASFPQMIERAKLSGVQNLKLFPKAIGNEQGLFGIEDISKFLDMIVQYSSIIPFKNKLKFLSLLNLEKRFETLQSFLKSNALEKSLDEQAQEEIYKDQEEYFLRKKLAAINKRLTSGKG